MRLVDADHLVFLVNDATILGDGFKQAFTAIVNGEPTIEPKRKWETCFDCPLSHGCPKISGCTNEQAEKYASEIPHGCPLDVEPERKTGKWIYGENDCQDGWYCSECEGFIPWDYDYYGLGNINFIKDFKTCPYCGSRMISYTGMEEGEQE